MWKVVLISALVYAKILLTSINIGFFVSYSCRLFSRFFRIDTSAPLNIDTNVTINLAGYPRGVMVKTMD